MSLADDIKSFFAEISNRHKYLHGKKGALEKPFESLKDWTPKKNIGKIARALGIGTIDLSWFLFCLGKYTLKDLNTVFLDNRIIKKWQEDNKNRKISKDDSGFKKFFEEFQKKHPAAAARLRLWMVYTLFAGAVVGGEKLAGQINKDKEQNNIESILNQDKRTYRVSDTSFRQKIVDDNWPEIVVGLLEFETYRSKPSLHSGESRYTYGPGLTWVYINGEQNACVGKYKELASSFSDYEIWDQVKQHCLYSGECLSVIQETLKKQKISEINSQQALALLFAAYQTPKKIKPVIKRLKDAGRDQQKIIDAFIANEKEIAKKWLDGTNKRRWWCAMLYTGKITVADFLNMDRDAFSEIDINTIMKKGHFVHNRALTEYAMNLKNTKVTNPQSVKDFMIAHNVLTGEIKTVEKIKIAEVNIEERTDPSMEQMVVGLRAFNSKDYEMAIRCYQKAIDLDVNNMEAYSSLALAYKKLGDKKHSVSYYEKSLEIVVRCNKQMNANKDLLYDPDVKAATYFNAGLAREEMAKIYTESNNKEIAFDNYKKAKQNFETALENAKNSAQSGDRIPVYEKAIQRVEKNMNLFVQKLNESNKKMAFEVGCKKIKSLSEETGVDSMVFLPDDVHSV